MGSQGSLPVKGSHSTLRKNVDVVTVRGRFQGNSSGS